MPLIHYLISDNIGSCSNNLKYSNLFRIVQIIKKQITSIKVFIIECNCSLTWTTKADIVFIFSQYPF